MTPKFYSVFLFWLFWTVTHSESKDDSPSSTTTDNASDNAIVGRSFTPELLLGEFEDSQSTMIQVDVPEWGTESVEGNTCYDIQDCGNCSNTYTCHWCDFDQACHARGSIHGCAWGSTCSKKTPNENSTCALHTTCDSCALSSHFCHWCEHDNACHSVGSPYGCSVGVDCYSNDRCRRSEPEPFHRLVVLEIPKTSIIATLAFGAVLMLCLSCCHYYTLNGRRSDGDVTTMPPPSEPAYTLMTNPEEDDQPFFNTMEVLPEDGKTTEHGTTNTVSHSTEGANVDEESPQVVTDNNPDSNPTTTRQSPLELDSNDSVLLSDTDADATTPLLPAAPQDGRDVGEEAVRRTKSPHRVCTCFYYLGVLLVLALVTLILYFYPKPPVYDVCNDAVAWRQIMTNIVEFKLDASFEILTSVSNPNHVTIAVDRATGSFSFEGNQVGTYEIPPVTATGMAITDMMLIAKVTPDRSQALKLAQAYYHGNLVLVADFNATLRAPAFFDFTYDFYMSDIQIYVNELGPRDLCHCPSWDHGGKEESFTLPFF